MRRARTGSPLTVLTTSSSSVLASLPTQCPRTIHSTLRQERDRKSTRLNSSHSQISYAVFCLKKKNKSPPRSGLVHDAFIIQGWRASLRPHRALLTRSAAPLVAFLPALATALPGWPGLQLSHP